MKQCAQCNNEFQIFDEDHAFYKKIDVPEPSLCSSCRDMRRWASGNDLTLYRAACDLCKKEMISMYSPNSTYAVFCNTCWWSDRWDPLSFGTDYDFSRSFFEQFRDLQLRVPRMATSIFDCESSPYVNNCGGMKNCYMCTSCGYSEDSFHLIWGVHDKDCADCFRAVSNELCYELINTNGSYGSAWLYQCEGMTGSYFCYDCRNCDRCIFSSNLWNKSLHIFNKPVSEQDYAAFVQTLRSAEKIKEYKQIWRRTMEQGMHKHLSLHNCEDVTGDNVSNSVNSYALFDSEGCENVRYSRFMFNSTRDCMDISAHGDGCELSYEGYGLGTDGVNRCFFTRQCCQGCDSVFYSDLCFNAHDLFGCICLRNASFCILNKKYTEQEYRDIKQRIVSHMKETGEWGEYFPGALSPFGYNESSAMLYYPLSKNEALERGYSWNDDMPETKGKETISWDAVPDTIEESDESITSQVFACDKCARNYKIIKQEWRLLKKIGLPLPRHCPPCRHAERISLRNPAQFWHRQCMCQAEAGQAEHGHSGRCATEFETTYAPERFELVYCEKCYQKELV